MEILTLYLHPALAEDIDISITTVGMLRTTPDDIRGTILGLFDGVENIHLDDVITEGNIGWFTTVDRGEDGDELYLEWMIHLSTV